MKKRSIVLFVFATLLWLFVGVAFVFVVPVFNEMFMDFGSRMPAMSCALIAFSRFVRATVFLPFLQFLAVLVGVGIAIAKGRKRLYLLIFSVSGAVAALLIVIALLLPIFQMAAVVGDAK